MCFWTHGTSRWVDLNCFQIFCHAQIGILAKDFRSIIHCTLGSPKPPDKSGSRVFTSCCWFLIITVIATYTGNLVAFSTMKKVRLPVKNLEELAAHSEYQAGVSSGGSTISLFRVSEQKEISQGIPSIFKFKF